MNTLDDRERAFEAKFAHDAEIQFKVMAKRNHLLGLWAASLLHKNHVETESYAEKIVKTGIQGPNESRLVEKLVADLGTASDPQAIKAQMKELMIVAKQQIVAES